MQHFQASHWFSIYMSTFHAHLSLGNFLFNYHCDGDLSLTKLMTEMPTVFIEHIILESISKIKCPNPDLDIKIIEHGTIPVTQSVCLLFAKKG